MYNKVMIIDDNEMDLLNSRISISESCFAHTVIVQKTAEDALAYLAMSDDLPEVIFLDVNMPGLNGFDFLERFSELGISIRSKCKVVMLSSSSSKEDRQHAAENIHVNKYIVKPLDASSLFTIN
jgi:CheY-like chemotaxis protein